MSGQPSRSKSTMQTDAPIEATCGMMWIELGIERRRLMNEIDTSRVRDLLQVEAMARQCLLRIERCVRCKCAVARDAIA